MRISRAAPNLSIDGGAKRSSKFVIATIREEIILISEINNSHSIIVYISVNNIWLLLLDMHATRDCIPLASSSPRRANPRLSRSGRRVVLSVSEKFICVLENEDK